MTDEEQRRLRSAAMIAQAKRDLEAIKDQPGTPVTSPGKFSEPIATDLGEATADDTPPGARRG
jgi:hypothetical protein